jgi:glycosyltransferase involved in cell wall biosynthesis
MTSAPRFESISAITVVDARVPPIADFNELVSVLAKEAADFEIIVIANGVSAATAAELRTVAESVANLTVHFLAQQANVEAAVLVGIDQALGDCVVILTSVTEEAGVIHDMLKSINPYEVVFSSADEQVNGGVFHNLIMDVYLKLYKGITGWDLEKNTPRVRIYTRDAARYIALLLDGEFALRSRNFSGSFPSTSVAIPKLSPGWNRRSSLRTGVKKAFHGLVTASAAPLRGVIGLALLASVIAISSSIYALVSYLIRDNIAPGWVTLSLQISLLTFLLSAMFALLGEYTLNVYRVMAPRRTVNIVREIRSPIRHQANRLNVIGSDGSFQMGAPKDAAFIVPATQERS